MAATSLKAGATFLFEGKPYRVIKYQHQKIARGGGTVKLTVRNLVSGVLEEKTLNSSVKVEKIETIKKPLQYLYQDTETAVFMNPQTFEQIELPLAVLDEQLKFIKEGDEVNVLFWGEKALSIDIPPKVVLKVVETSPGVKGDSATNIFKPAVVENGLHLKVPLFIKKGDRIRVDTRTGEYIERVR